MTIGKFIIGLLVAGVGFLLVWKSEWLLNNFGRINFAEKYLRGSGGTRLMYKIFGVIIIIIGFMYVTDLTRKVFGGLLNFVFKTNVPVE